MEDNIDDNVCNSSELFAFNHSLLFTYSILLVMLITVMSNKIMHTIQQ